MRALQKRTFTICSDEHSKNAEVSKVRLNLLNNGYSYKLINKREISIMRPRFVRGKSEEPKQNTAAHVSEV